MEYGERVTSAAPIDMSRVRSALDGLGTKYRVDDDGEFIGWWGDTLLMGFMVVGSQQDILQIWGGWAARPPVELFGRFIEVCNSWNAEKRWPKVYAVADDEVVRVRAELNVDCEGGVTDEWIVQQVTCAIGTAGQFCSELEELYPEYQAWLPES